MKINSLLIGMGMFFIAHALTFVQLNGQFLWKSFQKNEFLVALSGVVLSFFYLWGTKYTVEGVGGLLWPTRFIGFTIGMIIYALGVSFFFKEGFKEVLVNNKTPVLFIASVLLAYHIPKLGSDALRLNEYLKL